MRVYTIPLHSVQVTDTPVIIYRMSVANGCQKTESLAFVALCARFIRDGYTISNNGDVTSASNSPAGRMRRAVEMTEMRWRA